MTPGWSHPPRPGHPVLVEIADIFVTFLTPSVWHGGKAEFAPVTTAHAVAALLEFRANEQGNAPHWAVQGKPFAGVPEVFVSG